ncbi:hypothetical protein E5K00_21425 [Hymenobacter aquaticus]|uniref:Uncharacterized protein n=1 Tax=Hymenobacter aquaticus TaxID=1867101 RepID=A0A4Z0PSA5_9BACT|nr:hypothetical protein [Hymenobacter aquaticus]TGE20558.1 hypothetical protein E5K00_21425 [Hymenobacter aquaticus]
MLTNLSNILVVLIALSVAAERLVEIIKGIIPGLDQENSDVTKERWRKILLQVLAAGAGIVTAILAFPALAETLKLEDDWNDNFGVLFLLGLLASGGSGFWTSIQGYVNKVKEIKKVEAAAARVTAAATVAAIAQGSPAADRPAARYMPQEQPAPAALPGLNSADQAVADQAQQNLTEAVRLANNVFHKA